MVNPHCPTPAPADAPLPRLSWEDKWALAGRRREPGMRELLSAILDQVGVCARGGRLGREGLVWGVHACARRRMLAAAPLAPRTQRICPVSCAQTGPAHARVADLTSSQPLQQEDSMHLSKPPGTLRGRPKRLRLLVALDATRNAIALREASQRNIPTVSLVAHNADMSRVGAPPPKNKNQPHPEPPALSAQQPGCTLALAAASGCIAMAFAELPARQAAIQAWEQAVLQHARTHAAASCG